MPLAMTRCRLVLALGVLPSASGDMNDAVEFRVPVDGASLHARVIGRGHPVIVLHGGPDFDHRYLLPDLDRLADSFRLVYYDQRGRGRSAEGVRPEDVTMASEIDDLENVRRYFRLGAPALLGHSWGALLALEYALRHPTGVSHLILMNPAPASATDHALFRKTYLEKLGRDMDRQRKIADGDAYQAGDLDAVIARYRIHFKAALTRTADYERLMSVMEAAFAAQGREGILKARATEERLMRETWQAPDYDLLPRLQTLRAPTLVIADEDDLFPAEIAANIADAIPDAKLITIPDCGHFAYLECGDQVRRAIEQFFPRWE